MGPAFYGLLGGFLVSIMPGAKRKQGLETLNVEQHRPPIAYIISYGILFIAFIGSLDSLSTFGSDMGLL